MISTKNVKTTKRVSTAALMLLLAGSPILTVGQTSSTQSNALETTNTQTERLKAKNNNDCDPGLAKRESKDKKKAKPGAKPTPSKEELEFEKVLLGIFG